MFNKRHYQKLGITILPKKFLVNANNSRNCTTSLFSPQKRRGIAVQDQMGAHNSRGGNDELAVLHLTDNVANRSPRTYSPHAG